MTKTKNEMRDEAYEIYRAIRDPAYEAYETIDKTAWDIYIEEIARIDALPDDDVITVKGKKYKLIT